MFVGSHFCLSSLSQFPFPVWVEETPPVGVTVKSLFLTNNGVITREKKHIKHVSLGWKSEEAM